MTAKKIAGYRSPSPGHILSPDTSRLEGNKHDEVSSFWWFNMMHIRQKKHVDNRNTQFTIANVIQLIRMESQCEAHTNNRRKRVCLNTNGDSYSCLSIILSIHTSVYRCSLPGPSFLYLIYGCVKTHRSIKWHKWGLKWSKWVHI